MRPLVVRAHHNARGRCLLITYKKVGVIPQNKYHVWVSQADRLVKQWFYYPQANDDSAHFVMPWIDYQQHGGVLLSGERGDRELTEITVFDELDDAVFTDF